ncbi:NB-ARC domain-containing protein [Sphaerisporangium sp. NPDC005289]|uniref:ATP-binding protein n=1 Tax=Sphaerisporangium sp. NPDC005289 TaxID=3155247 RepID=UPI0033A409D8
MTTFVGRRREVAAIARMLGESRLVTLTGVGGVGKTRLATRVAREVAGRFPGGAWFVELSSLRAPEMVGDAIRAALRVGARPGDTAVAVLGEFLAGRRTLLVLDTCEHLTDACAATVRAILAAAPGVRVLATSRRVLGVLGEARFEVEPLPVEGEPGPGEDGEDTAPAGGAPDGRPGPLRADDARDGASGLTASGGVRDGASGPTGAGGARDGGSGQDGDAGRGGGPSDDAGALVTDADGEGDLSGAAASSGSGSSGGVGSSGSGSSGGAASSGGGPRGAVALFTDRAASLVPGFAATPEVARLCRRLDGIPLAIELAAVRLRSLSFEQVAAGAGDRFALLSDTRRPGPARHRTLRTAIGWSHELCEPLERLLWARLSVFPADFDLAAAQEVCADAEDEVGAGLGREHVEDVLLALVDASVVSRVDAGAAVRFRMLDTIREYGAGWLRELGQTAGVRRRHRDHYLDLARRFDAEWFGAEQVSWYTRMRRELPNLREALGFCLAEPAEHTAGLDLAGRLTYLWLACGLVEEGRGHLRRALELVQPSGRALSRALWACAWLADLQGDLDEANDLATECMAQAFSHDDLAAAGWGILCCANTGLRWGYVTEALSMYERARGTHEQGGDRGAGLAMALTGQAYALMRLGRSDRALGCLRLQASLCDSRGDIWVRSSGEWVRGLIEADRGDYAAADRYARASLRHKWLVHDSHGMAMVLASLARTAAGLGDMDRAARLLGSGELVERSYGLRLCLPRADGLREQAESRARAVLGDRDFDTAFALGRELDLDSALAYALADASTGTRT